MIDIHHHLLYGLDDGSPDIETSVAMAEEAAKDGITHIVCTPHANSYHAFQPERNKQRLADLQDRVNGRVTLGWGCDFHLLPENIADALAHPQRYTINGRGYLLVEFPDHNIPEGLTHSLVQLQQAGMAIVLTHPERNSFLAQHPQRLAQWVQMGCLVQVTASSLYGRFGKTAERFSNELLYRNWIHVLSTDAHNLNSRPPYLKPAFDYVTQHVGRETAQRLCVTNPRAIFEGLALPDQPEPEGLFDDKLDFGLSAPTKPKSFLDRLFSR